MPRHRHRRAHPYFASLGGTLDLGAFALPPVYPHFRGYCRPGPCPLPHRPCPESPILVRVEDALARYFAPGCY